MKVKSKQIYMNRNTTKENEIIFILPFQFVLCLILKIKIEIKNKKSLPFFSRHPTARTIFRKTQQGKDPSIISPVIIL